VGATPGRCLLTAAEGTGAASPGLLDIVQLLRPVQWLKNALVALPMLASHRFEAVAMAQTAGAFVAFCLVASGIYAMNDVIDRASDAQHPSKRHRPVAAGRLSVGQALATGGLPGRGYRTSDLPLIGAMAIAAGYVSVLVLALYLQSDEVVLLYANPAPLWGVCLIVLFWISRLALLSHRGEVHADPVVHAVSDPVTLACLAAIPVLAALAV
jgi:4-hydroxybenzoate polyprenyltransferase